MPHYTPHRSWLVTFAVIILLLTAVTPVLADYIGPKDRTVPTTSCKVILNECQYVAAKSEYKYKMVDSWSCSNESKPWQAYPSDPPRECMASSVGDQYWSREDEVTGTTTYPPATISSTLQNCTLQNGWCTTPAQLYLSGTEPVAGYYIFAIEGTRNGQVFGCPTASCTVPLIQGNNSFTYWALSSFGDSSTMGTLTAKVDSQLPSIIGSFSGITGSNGWYIGPFSFNGSASDNTSGLASFTCTLDGSALGSCNSITVNTNGPHTLVLTARDNAGHIHTLTRNASIDTQNPILNASISGTLGSNGWYTAAQLNASASDPSPGSGLSSFEYNLDGSGWITFPASGTLELMEGKHSVDLRAIDKAGRTVSSFKTFWRDTVAPEITVSSHGSAGLNNWYITAPTISGTANDATSGLAIFEYDLDNGGWQTYTTPLTLGDGTHTLSFWAEDAAGIVTQVDRSYQVDTRVPQIAGNLSGTLGANDWYISEVTLSVSAYDPGPGSGIDTLAYVLDDNAESPYTDPVTISDGQHTLEITAKDKAGLSYSIQENLKIDTIQPDLKIESVLPNWIKDSVTLNGTASDGGSGLSRVELSVDGGQTWLTEMGPDSWDYSWNTLASPNGSHQVNIRARDFAGLISQQSINVGVDNQAPEISVPASWFQWDAVTLDIWDSHSGLSEARVEITDPTGRRPARIIPLDPQQFPLIFKWDRRFADNTLADAGTYDVKIIASDNLGNTTDKTASIKILLDILPAGPTATLQPYIREAPTATATPNPTAVSESNPVAVATQTTVTRSFGVIEPTAQPTHTPVSSSTPRVIPTYQSIVDRLESFFVPPDVSEEQVTEIGIPEETDEDSQPTPTTSTGVLWGTAATAAIGAAAAYAYEEKRKYEEELARQAELEAAKEERRKKIQERQFEKLEEKWAQERAWEEARQEALKPNLAIDRKADRFDQEQTTIWVAGQEAIKKNYEEKKKKEEEEKKKAEEEKKKELEMQAGLLASLAAMKQAEAEQEAEAPQPEPNWWEKAKSLVEEKIIQPVNKYIVEPYIQPVIDKGEEALDAAGKWFDEKVYEPVLKPALERSKEFIESETSWIKENVYEPYIKPVTKKITETVSKGITWANKEVYQPYIQPVIKKTIEDVSNDLQWLNKNIYQPYIQPAVTVINEKVYQPYIQPVVEKVNEKVTDFVEWVDEAVYQPFIEPVVNDINQNIIQPLVTKTTDWWEEYGEWVHGALDVAGFVPGLGEIADGMNGLIYLAEGRYLDASLSLVSMIPVLGDLSKAGKWTVGLGQELVDQAVKELVEEGAEKVLRKTGEELLEKVTKETLEEGTEKLLKEAGEELIENTAKEAVEEATEKAVKEISEEAAEQVSKTVAEKTVKEVPGAVTVPVIQAPIVEKALETISEEAAQRVLQELVEGKVTKLPSDLAAQLTNESAKELAEKISKELGGKKVWVSPKTGSIYVSSPPPEAFALVEQLAKTDLTKKDEVERILRQIAELTSRGSGNHVVLGPFRPNGTFIQEALDTDGVFWDVGDELWDALDKTGIDMFALNDQFLRVQIDRGIDRIDVIGENVDEVIENFNSKAPENWGKISYTRKEILDLASMPDIPYQQVENSWIKIDSIQ